MKGGSFFRGNEIFSGLEIFNSPTEHKIIPIGRTFLMVLCKVLLRDRHDAPALQALAMTERTV